MTKKFEAMISHNKKEHNFEEIRAKYKIEQKAVGNKPPVVKFSEVRHLISRPMNPLVKTFYERYITDPHLIEKGQGEGKLFKGRLFIRPSKQNKWVGYVKIDCHEGSLRFPQVIRIPNLKLLNRAFHLDEVVVKLWGWCDWKRAKDIDLKGIDFNEAKELEKLRKERERK
jgi:hypothetical protein